MTTRRDELTKKLRQLDDAFAEFQHHLAALRQEQHRTIDDILKRVEKQRIEHVRKHLQQ